MRKVRKRMCLELNIGLGATVTLVFLDFLSLLVSYMPYL